MNKTLEQLLHSHGDSPTKLKLQTITIDRRDTDKDDDNFVQKYVLVEGDKQSLYFLGTVLLALANGDLGRTFDLHPQGAGRAHLSESSDIGIYLRREPCSDEWL